MFGLEHYRLAAKVGMIVLEHYRLAGQADMFGLEHYRLAGQVGMVVLEPVGRLAAEAGRLTAVRAAETLGQTVLNLQLEHL
jgi:hypothetical protein